MIENNYYVKNPYPVCKQSDSFQHTMKSYGTHVTIRKGSILIDPILSDQYFYYIDSGQLSVSLLSEDGRELLINYLTQGAIVGDATLLANTSGSVTIRAEKESSAYRLDSFTFRHLMESNCEFSMTIATHLSNLYIDAIGHLESTIFSKCKKRLYALLLEQSVEVPNNHGWNRVSHNYTHQQLALLVGANRVTVSRLLTELCDEKRVRVLNRKLEIRSSSSHKTTTLGR
jgi:CRP-like cAMP-binding protein